MDRRSLLRLGSAGLVWTTFASLSPLRAAKTKIPPAALLVPLTGASASLGLSMRRAAALAQPADDAAMMVLDTGGTPQGAQAAAGLALKRGAAFILGPLFAAETRAVAAIVAGRVPMLSFSNDEGLRESGIFLLGITAAQATVAILAYARRRGVRTVAMPVGTTPWSAQAAAASLQAQSETGLIARPVTGTDPATLRRQFGGELPDALFVADGGTSFAAAARAIQGSGVQLLGTLEALDPSGPIAPDVVGAWIAAPDPAAFGGFAQDYQDRNGGAPGALAALAFDGAAIVRSLRAAGRLDQAGLLQTASFPGVTGALHFRADGTAARRLAILVADANGFDAAPA